MNTKIQKRFITFEIITRGEQPIDLDDIAQDALLSGFHKVVSNSVDLRYPNKNGGVSHHDFIGIDITEIK